MNQPQPFQLTDKPSFPQRIFLKLMGSSIPTGGEIAPGITRFAANYSTSYAVAVGEGKFVLVDTGTDADAKEIIGFLASQNATPADVVAIFITHGHPDHFSGLSQFADVTVYVSSLDRGVLEGTAACEGFFPSLAGKRKKPAVAAMTQLQNIEDGQEIVVGSKKITAFSVPGHTRGSFVYLIDDLLFVGDAMTFGKNKAIKPPAPMSHDSELGVASLRKLVERFDAQGIVPKLIAPTHSGEGTLATVRELID